MFSYILFAALWLSPGADAAQDAMAGSADAVEAAAEYAVDLGPKVGEYAPADWSAADQTGAMRDLASLSGPNGAVIFFNRSLDWCPVCQRQTMEVESRYDDFISRGYGLAVVTTDAPMLNARFAGRHSSRTVLLADPDRALIEAFEIFDPVFIGRSGRFAGLPYPVAFVLSPEGEVLQKFWHEPGYGEDRGYRARVSTADIIASLDALPSGGAASAE
jgi:peroxiredoxin